MFLFPYFGTIIWITIIFLIVLYFLTKFAWKPLLQAIEQREKSVENSLKAAKVAELKLSELQNEQNSIIEIARQEKGRLLKEGVEQREKIILLAQERAHTEAHKIIEDARKKIIFERENAVSEMKNQIAALSVEIASKVVHADMDDKKRHEKFVNELINEVELN